MNLAIDPDELRPIVSAVVAEVVANLATLPQGNDRLAYTEPEAAAMLGIKGHALRDARLRGEIQATKAGGRIAYERTELLAYLARQRF